MVNTIALPPVVAEPTLAHDRYVTDLMLAVPLAAMLLARGLYTR